MKEKLLGALETFGVAFGIVWLLGIAAAVYAAAFRAGEYDDEIERIRKEREKRRQKGSDDE